MSRLCFIILGLFIICSCSDAVLAAPVIHPPPENATPGGDPANQNKPRYTWVQAEPGKSVGAAFPPGCKAPQQPDRLIFRDLKGVNLVILIPTKFQLALDCHGHEAQCTDSIPHYSPQERQDYQKLLTDSYSAYRQPLYRDNIVRVISNALKQNLMPFVIPGPDCTPPSVMILDADKPGNAVRDTIEGNPASLTITVTMRLEETTKPPIAILTANYFRPDAAYSNHWRQVPDVTTVIPLDLSDEQISTLLDRFSESIFNEGTTHRAN